jgi:peptide/nickel transport system substrate-binding protein
MNRNKMWFAVFIVLLIGAFPDFGQGAQVKDEVKIAAGQEVMALDPTLFTSGNDKVITENWHEYLIQRQPSGEITPGLVTSWKMAPDGMKVEATLRKGVKFIHGDPLTTKDVKFSYERGIAKNPSMKTNLAMVDRLEIIDDYKFNFYFKAPDVTFIPRLFAGIPIVSKSYYDRVGDEGFSKDPSGTGPYKFVTYKPGEYIDIERFEGYWGKKPPIKKARIYFIGEDSTRVAKLKAGEVDLIQGVPFTSVEDFRKDPNFKLVTLNTNHPTRSILMGSKNPKVPWFDKRVRLAMALAIDNKAVIHMLSDIPIYLPALAPSELGYDPTIKPYGYDPKKAKALLAEAGYPNGFEAEFNFPIGGRTSMTQETVEMIASYWAAVGIRVKLAGQETEAMLADRKKALDPKAVALMFYTVGMSGGVDPTHAIRNYLTSEGSRPGYSNPESDKIMVQARSTMNNKERAELIKKAARIIHDDVGYIPVFTAVSVYAMKKNIDFIPTKGINFDYMYVKDINIK